MLGRANAMETLVGFEVLHGGSQGNFRSIEGLRLGFSKSEGELLLSVFN